MGKGASAGVPNHRDWSLLSQEMLFLQHAGICFFFLFLHPPSLPALILQIPAPDAQLLDASPLVYQTCFGKFGTAHASRPVGPRKSRESSICLRRGTVVLDNECEDKEQAQLNQQNDSRARLSLFFWPSCFGVEGRGLRTQASWETAHRTLAKESKTSPRNEPLSRMLGLKGKGNQIFPFIDAQWGTKKADSNERKRNRTPPASRAPYRSLIFSTIVLNPTLTGSV